MLTVSWHESGRYLFPETGFIDEVGEGAAAGTSVNMPFEPFTGETAWLAAVRALLPTLAAVFGPDVIVSQHGADSHAWDPLAHLRVTTTAHAEAARLVDAVAHRWAAGRWLATGGGGYDAYRVVPRTWALTWLAGAHREPDPETPVAWRERWEAEAGAFGTPGMPSTFLDEPNAGQPVGTQQVVANEASLDTLERVRRVALPALVREAEDRGWWRPSLSWAGRVVLEGTRRRRRGVRGVVRVIGRRDGLAGRADARDAGDSRRFDSRPRTIPPFDPDDAIALLRAAAADGARVVGAVDGRRARGRGCRGAGGRCARRGDAARRRRGAVAPAGRPRAGAAAARSSTGGRAGATMRAAVVRGGAGRRRAAGRRACGSRSRRGSCAAPASRSCRSRPTSAATTRGRSRRSSGRADRHRPTAMPRGGPSRSLAPPPSMRIQAMAGPGHGVP